MNSRAAIAAAAADALEDASLPAAVIGFDGFVDSIIDMVDQRHDMSPAGYTRIPTIAQFAARCAAAAGKSGSIERVVREDRFGGNGPLLASAMCGLGSEVTYIGAVGSGQEGVVHPVFAPLRGFCRRVIPTGPPSGTQCLEFDDGKLMLNETVAQQAVTWERIVAAAGLAELRRMFDNAGLIAVVNWSLLGGVPGIWRGLMRDVLPHLSRRPRRMVIDLADPNKRSDDDLRAALEQLGALNHAAPVTLCLNLNEAQRIDGVLGLGRLRGAGEDSAGAAVKAAAGAIRSAAGLETVQIHLRRGAGAADGTGSAWFDGPFTATPRLSTGAGDHFNGGFAAGQALGLTLEESLAIGCAASGAYVRDAASPGRERLVGFLRDLPGPEGG